MKPDFLPLFNDFFSSGKLPKGINSSFLVLIPKAEVLIPYESLN